MSELLHRVDVRYQIDWETGWHVGSGFGTAAVDRLVRRRSGTLGPPYVPGSQIKGVLRHACERLAETLGCRWVSPHAVGKQASEELLPGFRPLRESKLLIDRLFGTRYQGECLFVEDAVPAGNDEQRKQRKTSPRTRVAMDRLTGTAREKHLFGMEVAEQSAGGLSGAIRARHGAGVLTQDEDGFPYEYALLVLALLGIDSLGGSKSAGLGRCTVRIPEDKVHWRRGVLADGKVCWQEEWLDTGQAIAGFQEEEWGEWVRTLREDASQ